MHFLTKTPRANLVAAFSPDEKEIAWAQTALVPYGCKLYTNYDEMLRHEGLEAVVISTVTTVHAEQAIKAMEHNLHVLCEKPLSTSVEIVRRLCIPYGFARLMSLLNSRRRSSMLPKPSRI